MQDKWNDFLEYGAVVFIAYGLIIAYACVVILLVATR